MRALLALNIGVVLFVSSVYWTFADHIWSPNIAGAGHEQDESVRRIDDLRHGSIGNKTSTQAETLVPPVLLASPTNHNGVLSNSGTRALSFVRQQRKFSTRTLHTLPDLLIANQSSNSGRAHQHPHGGKVCASGCVLSHHPTAKLSKATFRDLMAEFANDPLSEQSRALEALLYYGQQARKLTASEGTEPLDDRHAKFLARELSRTQIRVSFRVVDEQGAVRAWLPPTRVPFDVRHVFKLDVNGLQPFEASGTVKRVGLHHLWTRI